MRVYAPCQEYLYANLAAAPEGAYLRCVASTIARRIRETRKAAGFSQGDLAKRLGRQRPGDVSQWETGARTPTRETLQAIAQALAVTYETLDPDNQAWDPEQRVVSRLRLSRPAADDTELADQGSETPIGEAQGMSEPRERDINTLTAGFGSLRRAQQDAIMHLFGTFLAENRMPKRAGGSKNAKARRSRAKAG